jgi:hypothetical protein
VSERPLETLALLLLVERWLPAGSAASVTSIVHDILVKRYTEIWQPSVHKVSILDGLLALFLPALLRRDSELYDASALLIIKKSRRASLRRKFEAARVNNRGV